MSSGAARAARCSLVIDVTAPRWHAAVMQRHDQIGVGAYRERVSDCSFGSGTLVKGGFMLRRTLDGEKQPADTGMSLSRALVAVALTTLVLAHQALPTLSRIRRRISRHRHRHQPALSRHGIQVTVRASGSRHAAVPAASPAPQLTQASRRISSPLAGTSARSDPGSLVINRPALGHQGLGRCESTRIRESNRDRASLGGCLTSYRARPMVEAEAGRGRQIRDERC